MNGVRTMLIVAAALLTGCVSLKTPEGFAEMERTGRYDYKAVSTDASVITVRKHHNDDEDQGTLAYWSEAARKHLTLGRGYEFQKEGDFDSDQGPGHWMLFSHKYRGVLYLYILGIVVDDDDIYSLEATGEKEYFEKDVARVIEAFATLD